jgi:thiamine pyrophosphokinase
MARTVIFANGHLEQPEMVRTLIHKGDILVAADGGTRNARMLGITPAVIIGDLDSHPAKDISTLEQAGVKIIRHPREKNETDLELALQYAAASGSRRMLVVGALGGRLDQTLANLALLTDPGLSSYDIRFDDGREQVFLTRRSCQVNGSAGDLVSLIPWGSEVSGITTRGLRWQLNDDTLFPSRTRGISNELLGTRAAISLKSGLLLIVHRRLRK